VTQVYPDGAAPYFTVIAPGRRGDEVAMWDDLKAAASEIPHEERATITHHDAVRPRPPAVVGPAAHRAFAAVLRAAKRTLDPYGVLNPGVLMG